MRQKQLGRLNGFCLQASQDNAADLARVFPAVASTPFTRPIKAGDCCNG
ncbi:MAG: hypothetical protein ACLGHV_07965 [Gammaproteobacteria bacterium]